MTTEKLKENQQDKVTYRLTDDQKTTKLTSENKTAEVQGNLQHNSNC
jgi:hypothetical protein